MCVNDQLSQATKTNGYISMSPQGLSERTLRFGTVTVRSGKNIGSAGSFSRDPTGTVGARGTSERAGRAYGVNNGLS